MKYSPATKEQLSAAITLVKSQAYTKTIKPVVEKIHQDVLDKFKYKYSDFERSDEYGEFIRTKDHSYMMSEKDFGHYLTEVHQRYLQAGFVVELGYCPLLMAESNEIKAKQELVLSMEPITKLKWHQFFNTADWKKNLDRFVDLTLKLLIPQIKGAAV